MDMAPSETKVVPAIGYSFVCTFAPDRQITFQHFIGADETDAAVNASLDRLMGFADRLRSKYQLPDMKLERDKLLEEISQAEQDLAEADLRYEKAQADLDVQALELHGAKDEKFKAGYEEYRRAGRQGSYTPKGATKNVIDRANQGLEAVFANKAKNEAERDQFRGNVEISLKRRRDRVAVLESQIGDLEKEFG